jgi:uncharacterized membrane protein
VTLAITTYNWLKAFHVIGAVLWVGGGVTSTILALMMQRANDPVQLAKHGANVAKIGERFFGPISLITFGLGIGMVEEGSLGWTYDQFWIIFGLVVFGISAATGSIFLGPESGRLSKLMDERGPEDEEVQARLARILRVARVDQFLLLLVVFDMTAKPFL